MLRNSLRTLGVYISIDILPAPRLRGGVVPGDSRIRPRNLHFLKQPSQLIVSYPNHGVGVALYSIKNRKQIGSFDMALVPERNVPSTTAVLEDTSTLVCGSHDGSVFVWDVASSELSQRLDHQCMSGSLHDCNWLTFFPGDGLVQCVSVSQTSSSLSAPAHSDLSLKGSLVQ